MLRPFLASYREGHHSSTRKKYMKRIQSAVLIAFTMSLASWAIPASAGQCTCRDATGSSYGHCADSISACRDVCNRTYNPGNLPNFVTYSFSAGSACANMIQNCEVACLSELGYPGTGHKHNFCGSRGYASVVPYKRRGMCFRPVNGDAQKDCPRLWAAYTNAGGMFWQHLAPTEGDIVKRCGR
jgi:hypothetical protein